MLTLFIIYMIMGLGIMICKEIKDKIESKIRIRNLAKYYNSEEYKIKKKEEELKEEEEKRRKEEQKRIEAEKRHEELCIIRNEIIDELIEDEYITVEEVIKKYEAKHNRRISRMRVEDEIDYQNIVGSQRHKIKMDKRGKQRPKNSHEEFMELIKDAQRITENLNEAIEDYEKIKEKKKAKGISIHRDYENMSDYDYYRAYYKDMYGVTVGRFPGEASEETKNKVRNMVKIVNNAYEAQEKVKELEKRNNEIIEEIKRYKSR